MFKVNPTASFSGNYSEDAGGAFDLTMTLNGYTFVSVADVSEGVILSQDVSNDGDLSLWITNLPAGLTAEPKAAVTDGELLL